MRRAFILFLIFFSVVITTHTVFAVEAVTFPIEALGGCASQVECRSYCADTKHADACTKFAKQFGVYRNAVGAIPGPHGCNSVDECRTYCDEKENRKECIEFVGVERTGTDERYAKAKTFLTIIETFDQGPGGCKNERECAAYCDVKDHAHECYEFAVMNGFATRMDAARGSVMAQGGPGGCSNSLSCVRYCADMFRIRECLVFAANHGFIDKTKSEQLMMSARAHIGGCAGSEECRNFCYAYPRECVAIHAVEARDVREGALFAAPILRWLRSAN